MQQRAMMTENGLRMVCGWFAMCERPADKAAPSPISDGPIPICDKHIAMMKIPADRLQDIEVIEA